MGTIIKPKNNLTNSQNNINKETQINYYKISVSNIVEKTNVYLYLRKNGFSEHYLKNLRNKDNAILVNSSPSTARTILNNGDILEIDKNPYSPTKIKKVEKDIDVVYEDENYLLVNKPPLLATMPTKSHYEDNLAGRIVAYINDGSFTLRVFNRLDREASGLILISKDAITHQFTEILNKEYYAICHGILENKTIIEKPILTINNNGINEMKRVISPLGQYAKTTLTPVKALNDKTLLKAEIIKGRTHQIRLHCASITHSLIGDKIYGINDEFSHTFLHLKSISFYNKLLNKNYHFEINLPEEFEKVIK